MSDEKIVVHYGMTIINPSLHCKITEGPPPTFLELVQCALYEFWSLAVPSFWLACSITAFRWAFGGFG